MEGTPLKFQPGPCNRNVLHPRRVPFSFSNEENEISRACNLAASARLSSSVRAKRQRTRTRVTISTAKRALLVRGLRRGESERGREREDEADWKVKIKGYEAAARLKSRSRKRFSAASSTKRRGERGGGEREKGEARTSCTRKNKMKKEEEGNMKGRRRRRRSGCRQKREGGSERDGTKRSGPVGISVGIGELRGLIVLYRLGSPEGETRGFVPSNLPLVIHRVMIRF